jgi:hypothetical protein
MPPVYETADRSSGGEYRVPFRGVYRDLDVGQRLRVKLASTDVERGYIDLEKD